MVSWTSTCLLHTYSLKSTHNHEMTLYGKQWVLYTKDLSLQVGDSFTLINNPTDSIDFQIYKLITTQNAFKDIK